MKRCLDVDNPFVPEKGPQANAGTRLRDFVVGSLSTYTVVTAAFVGELCDLISAAGGIGVADLATLDRANASKYLKLRLGREYEAPGLYYVNTPLYNKKVAGRVSEKIPIHLPSDIFSREMEDHNDPASSIEPASSSSRFHCKAWVDSEVRKSSNLHWSRIIPCSLYWDGFAYGVRESAEGVYIRNLRTNEPFLVAILRRQLSSLNHRKHRF